MAKIKMTENRKEFVRAAYDILGVDTATLTRKSIKVVLENYEGLSFHPGQLGTSSRPKRRANIISRTWMANLKKTLPRISHKSVKCPWNESPQHRLL